MFQQPDKKELNITPSHHPADSIYPTQVAKKSIGREMNFFLSSLKDLSSVLLFKEFPCKSNSNKQARGSLPIPTISNIQSPDSLRKPRIPLSLAQMPGCQGQSPEKADLASNARFSGTSSNSCQRQPSAKPPCLSRLLIHSAELRTMQVNEGWGFPSQKAEG